jgi:hypothetical protein
MKQLTTNFSRSKRAVYDVQAEAEKAKVAQAAFDRIARAPLKNSFGLYRLGIVAVNVFVVALLLFLIWKKKPISQQTHAQ